MMLPIDRRHDGGNVHIRFGMPIGPGLRLSSAFYDQVVSKILRERFPNLSVAVARIGRGSEVLGFDTPVSTDHDYGPSLQIFLREQDFPDNASRLLTALDQDLPSTFQGWKTHYTDVAHPSRNDFKNGAVGSSHGVTIYTVNGWCKRFLQRRMDTNLTMLEWLAYPEQMFLLATAGQVFRDDFAELNAMRESLSYYPRDVWLFKLSAQWRRTSEERAYIGRAGDSGDELGSKVIAARMVEKIMKLAMLIERQYAPYSKWFGTAFSQLACAPDLTSHLQTCLDADSWPDREAALATSCRFLANLQLAKEIPGAMSPEDGSIHGRKYQFVDSLKISEALFEEIEDETIKGLNPLGGPDQYLSSHFLLAVPAITRAASRALLSADIRAPNS